MRVIAFIISMKALKEILKDGVLQQASLDLEQCRTTRPPRCYRA